MSAPRPLPKPERAMRRGYRNRVLNANSKAQDHKIVAVLKSLRAYPRSPPPRFAACLLTRTTTSVAPQARRSSPLHLPSGQPKPPRKKILKSIDTRKANSVSGRKVPKKDKRLLPGRVFCLFGSH